VLIELARDLATETGGFAQDFIELGQQMGQAFGGQRLTIGHPRRGYLRAPAGVKLDGPYGHATKRSHRCRSAQRPACYAGSL
jgi:hypothetical protein